MDTLSIQLGGAGDCLLGVQCGFAAKANQPNLDIEYCFCVRDEVYEILKYVFDGKIFMFQESSKEQWGENDGWICKNQQELKKYPHPNIYVTWPDDLYRNPLAFDLKRFNLSLDGVRKTRVLTDRWKPEKIITVNLNTTTIGYNYFDPSFLISYLAQLLPDYTIYVPIVEKWANQQTKNQIPKSDLKNVIIDVNPPVSRWLDYMFKSEYGIYTDNGPSHISWALSQNRLILDPRFSKSNIMWQARWRENGLDDSIDIYIPPQHIAKLVENNIRTPQTLLLPKSIVASHPMANWNEALGFKY